MEESQEDKEASSDASENEEILESFRLQKQKILENEIQTKEIPGNDSETVEAPQIVPEEIIVEASSTSKFDINTPSSQNISFDSDSENKISTSEMDILKKLESSENAMTSLKEELSKKDELINVLEQEKKLIEREKQMLKRDVEVSVREKENAVMRYAIVEKNVLDMKNSKENCEKKVKELNREIELLNGKLKGAANEKSRICSLFDGKCHELKSSQKEVEKLKADLIALETKFKWNNVKLKQEMESKFIAEKKVEDLTLEVNQLKMNEIEKAKEEIEVERNMLAEKQLMEQNATLILLKHGNEEKEKRIEIFEKRLKDLHIDFDSLNEKYKKASKENQEFLVENERVQQELIDAQTLLDKQTLKIAELQSNLNDLESMKTQLTLEKETNRRNKLEIEILQTNYDDQSVEMNRSREKESELLQLNKELTETVVKLKNDCSLSSSKCMALSLENEAIKKDKKYYDDIISELRKELDEEIRRKMDERQLMAKHISEKTLQAESFQKKFESALGDLEAARNKHSQRLKELNREVAQLRKKCDQYEEQSKSKVNVNGTSTDNACPPGNSTNNSEKEKETSTENSSSHASDSDSQSTHNEFPSIQIQEPSKKTLIDRIVRLQHAMARQTEKVDFLENHSAQLVGELQKKSKLINYYMLREKTGALSSSKSDKHKAELAKYGGIMAAITNGVRHPNSAEMTLDLSLEINKKLQAVLEDTLLKNITLKENLDTLGLEVDKLTRKLASKS